VVVTWGVIGLVVGALVTWVLLSKRAQGVRADLAQVRSELSTGRERLADAQAAVERERFERTTLIDNLRDTFEATSNRVLKETVSQFSEGQEKVLRERDAKLKDNIEPLTVILNQYQRALAEFDQKHQEALSKVDHKTGDLLEAQRTMQEETRRLNQLLGRSDQRGHWGEIQLGNVLEASGLKANIDYSMQVTHIAEGGGRQRPDCIVKMPNGASIVIDAKFPFDDFERAIVAEDPQLRREGKEEFARKLRGHIKVLKSRAYQDSLPFSPDFTVCFVPSDAALGAAFEADAELHDFSVEQRVLLAGPTNLLALLWSASMVLSQHETLLNAQEIRDLAGKLYNRIRLVAEPMAKMGSSLDAAVESYNKMVKSAQANLLSTARRVRGLSGATGAKPLPELDAIEKSTQPLDQSKWGVDLGDPELAAQSEILDLDEYDDADDVDSGDE
jgi:DNA recombination protein RmuC